MNTDQPVEQERHRHGCLEQQKHGPAWLWKGVSPGPYGFKAPAGRGVWRAEPPDCWDVHGQCENGFNRLSGGCASEEL